jgi:hypothetical protein
MAFWKHMADTWIIDLRHFLTPAGAIDEMPAPARRLAEYFASIVVDATSNLDDPPTVRCRRRLRRRRCPGRIDAIASVEDHEAIVWHCPVCGDQGVIRGWTGTLWDGFAAAGSQRLS